MLTCYETVGQNRKNPFRPWQVVCLEDAPDISLIRCETTINLI